MSRKKEEERLERIIRGLLKLPENKRCINCNHLGPQYVCTTFLTFVCTTCSGVHREFSHRVKSVSMAKFKSEEVTALQAAGNERARQIYLKAWDPERNTHPDGSNIHRIREFIRHVYVERIYTGERSFKMRTTMAKSGQKGSLNEKHFIEQSGLGSREDFYERRYHERATPTGRSDRNDRDYINDRNNRNHIDGKDYKIGIEGRSPDSIYERYGTLRSRSAARFEIVDNTNQNDRYGRRSQSFRTTGSDTSLSTEPQRIREKADNMAPESQRITENVNLPVLRPLKDIMGENPPTLEVSDPPKAIKGKDANAAAYDQKKSFSDSHGSVDVKADDNKAASASGLIQDDNKSELSDTSTKAQTESGFSVQSSTEHKTNNPPKVNSVEYLLFELSGLPVVNASEKPSSNAASLTAPATLFTSPVAPSTESAASSVVPTASGLPVGNASGNSSSVAGSLTAPASLSTLPVASSVVPTASSIPVALSPVPKASSTKPVTSSTGATTTESASTPRTSVTTTGVAVATTSPVENAQNHPFSSAYPVAPVAEVAEEKKIQTTQQQKPSASPAGTNSSTSPQGTPAFEAFVDQPSPSLSAPTAQKASGDVSADQSPQAVSKAAQTTTSPRNGSKSTGRKELPAELFTFSYPTYSASINNWQICSPYGVGYGMQYAPSPRVIAFPGTTKSMNPFDLGDDSRPVQGAMLSSIASFPGAVPQTSPHAGLQPQPSPFACGLPPESPSYRMNMSVGAVPQTSPHAGLQARPSPFASGLPPEPPSYRMNMSVGAVPQTSPHAGLQLQASPFACGLPPESPSYRMNMSVGAVPQTSPHSGLQARPSPFASGLPPEPPSYRMNMSVGAVPQTSPRAGLQPQPSPFASGMPPELLSYRMNMSVGAVPQTSPHARLQPQPSPFASGLPPEPPSYRVNMSAGGYMGHLPKNTPSPRPQGIGSFGGDGNTAFVSLDPYQHPAGGYSSNLVPTASNSLSSAGGNPFA